jgi:hypothetical protein
VKITLVLSILWTKSPTKQCNDGIFFYNWVNNSFINKFLPKVQRK